MIGNIHVLASRKLTQEQFWYMIVNVSCSSGLSGWKPKGVQFHFQVQHILWLIYMNKDHWSHLQVPSWDIRFPLLIWQGSTQEALISLVGVKRTVMWKPIKRLEGMPFNWQLGSHIKLVHMSFNSDHVWYLELVTNHHPVFINNLGCWIVNNPHSIATIYWTWGWYFSKKFIMNA